MRPCVCHVKSLQDLAVVSHKDMLNFCDYSHPILPWYHLYHHWEPKARPCNIIQSFIHSLAEVQHAKARSPLQFIGCVEIIRTKTAPILPI